METHNNCHTCNNPIEGRAKLAITIIDNEKVRVRIHATGCDETLNPRFAPRPSQPSTGPIIHPSGWMSAAQIGQVIANV